MMKTLIQQLIISMSIMLGYYHYGKKLIIKLASLVANHFSIKSNFTTEATKGIIELILIVISHLIIAWYLIRLLSFSYQQLFFPSIISILILPFSLLLGLGAMGIASVLCRSGVEIMRFIPSLKILLSQDNWLMNARSGWMRHYLHAIQLLPKSLAVLIIFGQVFAEELMFRVICINYFECFSDEIAVIVATSLFMLMQVFQMPNRLSCFFPLIGALVIGLLNSILYLKTNLLWPLVFCHLIYFACVAF